MTAVYIVVMAQLRALRFNKKKVIANGKLNLFRKHTKRIILWAFILHTI